MSRAPALLACAPLFLACGTLLGGGGDPVAARLGDEVITVSEVDASIEQQLYELRAEALDDLITRKALEQRAAEAGTSVDDLVTRAGESVSDAEVAAFWEQRQADIKGQVPDATLEGVAPQIRALLESERRREFVQEVREQADYRIELEAPRLEVSVEGHPSLGPDDAPVTIVEWSDFQCPFCRRSGPVLKELVKRYPEQVRVVYRHLPLSMHSRARPSAEASACADEQGRFWDYHDLVFENPGALSDEDLSRYAAELGLDVARFDECYQSGRYAEQVRADAEEAGEVGITGTPGFVVNGRVVRGFKSVEQFEKIVEEELARLEAAEGDAS